MPTQVQFRRGTTAQNDSFTGAAGELSIDTQLKTLRVHDGTTQGGSALARAAQLTTANVSEVTNLYFTDARARAAISATGDINYDAETGVISFTNDAGDIESVAAGDGLTGGGTSGAVTLNVGSGYGITVNADSVEVTNAEITALVTKSLVDALGVDASTLDGIDSSTFALDADLTTANVVEVTNLYFTEARARAAISASGDISYDNSTGVISFDGSSYALDTDLTTANVAEVTNLYYTDVRAFANLSSATTTSLTEGTNLYFTASRAIGALASNAVSIGDLTITGNLFVQGDTVEVNTATLTVEDKNILLANGSINAAASDGAGITIDGSSANLIYLSTGDKWAFNKSLNVDGEITATGNVTSPFFYSESDAVLKEDIEPIVNPLKKILKLAGVSFTWKKSKQSGLGVIAQEVEKIVPEIVSTNLNGHKTVSYDSLVPILIEAVKEQQKQIEYLKKKIK